MINICILHFNGFRLDLPMPSNEMAIHKLYKAIHQIALLRLNHTEIACLKTLILFRPGEYLFDGLLYHRDVIKAMGGVSRRAATPPIATFVQIDG